MAELTIDLPGETARKLEPFAAELAELLKSVPAGETTAALEAFMDFLRTGPATLEKLLKFELPEKARDREQYLLDRNREAQLTAAESAELDLVTLVEKMYMHLQAVSVPR